MDMHKGMCNSLYVIYDYSKYDIYWINFAL